MNQLNDTTPMIVDDDEIDLGQLIRNIWSTRYTVIIAVSIFAALFASYIFFKAAAPRPLIYSQVINFAFNGAQEGKFDNGDSFHIQDILAPAVISQVHARHDLNRYGFTVDLLSESLSITPYAPDIDLIIKQFSPNTEDGAKAIRRVQNQAMIASEKAARAQLERELKIATSKSAQIRMVVMGSSLPVELARVVIADIPKVWAEMAISRGATSSSVSLYTPSYIEQAINKDENIENLQVLWAYLKDFQDQVTSLLEKYPGIKTIVDEQSGLSVLDISKLLKDAEKTLIRIPEDWSARPDFKVGLNEPLFSSRLFDQTLLEKLDYLVTLDILSQRIQLIRETLSNLKKYPYFALAKDPLSELAINDLNRFLSDLNMYELRPMRALLLQTGVSKEPETVPLYFEFRINELQRKVDTLQASSEIIQTAEARYVQGNSSANTTGRNASDGAVAQFSEGFLDQVMALNSKGDDLAYRQKLNQQSIELEEKAVKLNEEIKELRQYQQMITSQHASNANQGQNHSSQNKDELLQQFEKFVNQTLERLQEYAEITQRISDRLFTAREIHTLFSESEFAFSSPEQYLKRTSQVDTNFSDLLKKVKLYTLVVHNIFKNSHKDTITETGNLYQLAGTPLAKSEKTITRKTILLLILGSFLTGFFAMIGHLVYRSVKRR